MHLQWKNYHDWRRIGWDITAQNIFFKILQYNNRNREEEGKGVLRPLLVVQFLNYGVDKFYSSPEIHHSLVILSTRPAWKATFPITFYINVWENQTHSQYKLKRYKLHCECRDNNCKDHIPPVHDHSPWNLQKNSRTNIKVTHWIIHKQIFDCICFVLALFWFCFVWYRQSWNPCHS